uniref:Uncharacterized protein n=1 Tax=viral metagenome TaxID=1070528 RepID=A0A6M3IFM1_9ZZZZ
MKKFIQNRGAGKGDLVVIAENNDKSIILKNIKTGFKYSVGPKTFEKYYDEFERQPSVKNVKRVPARR